MAWSDAARAAAAEARKFKTTGRVPGTRGGTRQQFAGVLRMMRNGSPARGAALATRNASARARATEALKKFNLHNARVALRNGE